jgi:hypothetical protein
MALAQGAAIGVNEQIFGAGEQVLGRRWRSVHLEGTMRPTPEHLLPAQAAIFIMGCLSVFLSALLAFVITKAMIAIGIGAMALFIAGACAFAHRHALKPL